MLFGQTPLRDLKNISAQMWNAPLDSKDPFFYSIEVTGSIEDYHITSVRLISSLFSRVSIYTFPVNINFRKTEESVFNSNI
jgi:hypothetical protein